MHVGAPYSAVLSSADAAALETLAGVLKPLSGREIARISGAPKSTINRSLQRLVEHGVVEVEEAGAGAALLYSLNRDHLVTKPLLELLGTRRRLVVSLSDALDSWQVKPCNAYLFGSAARGDGDTKSDLDILLVRPLSSEDDLWEQQIGAFEEDVYQWTGNYPSVISLSMEQIDQLRYERPKIVSDLERDAITLVGANARELFRLKL